MDGAAGDRVGAALTELDPDAAVALLGGVDAAAVDQLLDVAGREVQADAPTARRALDLAETLAARFDRPEVAPTASYLRARMALNDGRTDNALGLIAAARAQWIALGRPLDAYRTELGRMHVLDDLGRHDEAVEAALGLLADIAGIEGGAVVDDDVAQLDWMRAAANENLGVAYGFTGRHDQALAAYRSAEAGYERVGDIGDIARCRGNRGVELVAVGEALDGLDVLEDAAAMFAECGDRHSHAKCLGHAADAELLLGRYADSLTRSERARTVLDELEATTEAARLRMRTVRAYLALNLVDEALALATSTVEVLADLGLRHDLAEARWLTATALLRTGRSEEALALLDLADDGSVESDDPALRIEVLLAKSEALAGLDRQPEAVEAARSALAVVAEGAWPTEELHVRLQVGELATTAAADEHLLRANELADELGLPHLRYPVLLALGRHHRRNGDKDEARRRLREAVDVVEGLRGLIADETIRTSYLEGRTAAHVELISMLIEDAGEAADADGATATALARAAFDVAEASKARTLADLVAGSLRPQSGEETGTTPSDRSTPSGSPSARDEADLDAAYSALVAGGLGLTAGRREIVHDRAVELERRLRISQLQADATSPSGEAPPQEDRAELRPPVYPAAYEHLVEYQVVGEALVAVVWSCGQTHLVTDLAPVAEIDDLVAEWDRQRLRHQTAGHLGAAGAAALTTTSAEILRRLWVAVFAPIASHLPIGGGRLLVVPHGPLNAVPFHALTAPDGPVGERWTITLAPSYTVAARVRDRPRPAAVGRSLVVGVPDEMAPAVGREAELVAGILPGAELLLGDEATVEAFGSKSGDPLDVVHLACHGIHRARNPMFSALGLADRWLTAREVMTMRFPGTLVVLSACESGRQSGPGSLDEPTGLARSFLAAGAQAVVVSQWLADDEATAELMGHFYQHLLAGQDPAGALQRARNMAAKTHPHPAAWAPFVIHGAAERERGREGAS